MQPQDLFYLPCHFASYRSSVVNSAANERDAKDPRSSITLAILGP